MKLTDWASMAEIISGIAVVVTLVFLVVGSRENTNTTRAVVYGDLIDGLNELETSRMNDPELMMLWTEFRRGETFNPDDLRQRRMGVYLQVLNRTYEKAYFSFRYGVIGANEWERFQEPICAIYGRMRAQGLGRVYESGALSPDYREYVAQACGE
jgi:hypothetical protein